MLERLRLPINVTNTRSMRVPDEPLEFLGYRIGTGPHSPCLANGTLSVGERMISSEARCWESVRRVR